METDCGGSGGGDREPDNVEDSALDANNSCVLDSGAGLLLTRFLDSSRRIRILNILR